MWDTFIPDLVVTVIGAALTVAIASVLSIKDAVKEARAHSRSVTSVHVPLSGMTSACNRYLELATRQPSRYWFFLMDLRSEIATQVEVLSKANRRVTALEPGAGSL